MLRAIVMLVSLLFAIHAFSGSQVCQERHCTAVIDAGSTGSRLYIYAYDLDDKNTPIHIDKLWSKKINPGIATIEPTQENINAYVEKLFAEAPEQNIPVYFYATGGMRLLSSPKQDLYYRTLQKWFATQTQWTLLEAKTISGKLEGVLGWLSVNYTLGTLQATDQSLVSVMDMGGASVQVSFPVEHINAIDSNDLMQIDIYNRHITLFVRSFLGLGQTEVSHQYLNAKHCFANDYPLPNESLGLGNATTCQQDISDLINRIHHVSQVVKPAIAANPVSSWYAISGITSLIKNKPFEFKNSQFSNQELLQKADRELCHQSWQTLMGLYPDNDYTFINCLTSSYYYGLMVNGYGLQSSQPINYMPGEDDFDWTLGVVLYPYQTNTH